MALLEIKNLSVGFDTSAGLFMAVQGIDMSVDSREVLAIVGESGSGKSVAMLAVMGLLPNTATVTADRMAFEGRDLLTMSGSDRRKIIGKDIAMIFQEPVASLNPCFTVGFQITETLRQQRIFIDIDFDDFDSIAIFVGRALQNRRQRPAGRAPRSRKIDDDRNRGCRHFVLKSRFTHFAHRGRCCL